MLLAARTVPAAALTDMEGAPAEEPWTGGTTLMLIGHQECGTTRLALPVVDRIHRRGGRVVAVLQDRPEDARALVTDLGLDLPVLLEPHPYPLARALGLETVPTLLLVEPGGTIALVSEGFRLADMETVAERLGVGGPLAAPGERLPPLRPG